MLKVFSFQLKFSLRRTRGDSPCFAGPGLAFFYLNFLSEELVKGSTDNSAAVSHEAAPTPDKESDEEVEDSYPALTEALAKLGLPEYVDLFEAEEMDMETFVSCRLRPTVSK